jgi:hypothetical protein
VASVIDPLYKGPTPGMVAWRRFLIETVVCVELIAVIAVVGIRASHELLAGVAIGGIVAIILRVIWRHS